MRIGALGGAEIFIIILTIILIIGLTVGLAFIPAKIAQNKGYSFAGFYVLGLFFFVIALIIALVIDEKQPAAPAPQKSSGDIARELEELKGLLDSDVVTQEEFDMKKRELLGLGQSK